MAATPLPPGVWVGPQVQMEVGAAGTRIRFDCAEAEIPGPLTPDAEGRFAARGHYEAYAGGPQVVDETPAARKPNARFSGRMDGDRLVLEIQRDGVEAPLRYTLVKGMRAKIIRCY